MPCPCLCWHFCEIILLLTLSPHFPFPCLPFLIAFLTFLIVHATPWTTWNSPGHSTREVSHSFLHGIFPTEGSNPGLPHFRHIFIFFIFILFLNFIYYYYFLLYNIVLVCHTSTCIRQGCTCVLHPEPPLPPPSPYHRSGSSQCTSRKLPVSCIEPGLAIRFLHDIIHVLMPFSQIIPHLRSPTESKRLFYTSVSLLLSCIQGYRYHVSTFTFTFIWYEWPQYDKKP